MSDGGCQTRKLQIISKNTNRSRKMKQFLRRLWGTPGSSSHTSVQYRRLCTKLDSNLAKNVDAVFAKNDWPKNVLFGHGSE